MAGRSCSSPERVDQLQGRCWWSVEVVSPRAAGEVRAGLDLRVAVSAEHASDQASAVVVVDSGRGCPSAGVADASEVLDESGAESPEGGVRVMQGWPYRSGVAGGQRRLTGTRSGRVESSSRRND